MTTIETWRIFVGLLVAFLAGGALSLLTYLFAKKRFCNHNFGGPKNEQGFSTCLYCYLPVNTWLTWARRGKFFDRPCTCGAGAVSQCPSHGSKARENSNVP
jgi:hypothetical protein